MSQVALKQSQVVVPNDVDLLDFRTEALYVGTAGDITVTLVGDSSPVLFKNVASGTFLPLKVNKVMATGTTALDILALK